MHLFKAVSRQAKPGAQPGWCCCLGWTRSHALHGAGARSPGAFMVLGLFVQGSRPGQHHGHAMDSFGFSVILAQHPQLPWT